MIDYVFLEEYGKKISVLFVEDDLGISKEMSLLLKEIFTEVEIAYDGREALKKYIKYSNENQKNYDLIITDIQMPNMNGIELIENIYKENPNQQVIVMSAHNESEYLMQLVNIGISHFILKPIEYDSFLNVIFKISKYIYEIKYQKSEEKQIFIKLNDGILWNKELKQLVVNNEFFKLTKKEFLLLDLLLKIPEKTYTNEEIIDYLWRDDFEKSPDINNLKNLISRLRKKLPSLNIENIYSFGYRLNFIE
uniref:response regulator transcription factor n=2 Tax=Aliarcobacter sp. TaxID=2321116 RepID=UPI004047B2DF